jgi:hypothetical protein
MHLVRVALAIPPDSLNFSLSVGSQFPLINQGLISRSFWK